MMNASPADNSIKNIPTFTATKRYVMKGNNRLLELSSPRGSILLQNEDPVS
jgi:hypothetical protein